MQPWEINSLDFNIFICTEKDEQEPPHIPQKPLQLLTYFYKERISETYNMLWDNVWGQKEWLRHSVYMKAGRTVDILFWGVTVELENAKGNATNSCSSTKGKACYFIDLLPAWNLVEYAHNGYDAHIVNLSMSMRDYTDCINGYGKPHLDCDEIILLSVVAGLYKMDKVAKRKKKKKKMLFIVLFPNCRWDVPSYFKLPLPWHYHE